MDCDQKDWNTAILLMLLTLTNGLKRLVLYQNFFLVMSRGYPLSKNNRVALSRCVMEKIREKYPVSEEDCYTGFIIY